MVVVPIDGKPINIRVSGVKSYVQYIEDSFRTGSIDPRRFSLGRKVDSKTMVRLVVVCTKEVQQEEQRGIIFVGKL